MPPLEEQVKILSDENRQLKEKIHLLELELKEYRDKIFKKNKKSRHDDEDDDRDNLPPGKKGAPLGHTGTTRKTPDYFDDHKEVFLSQCPHCHGTDLTKYESFDDHYQEDVVIIKKKVTRFRHHEYYCKTCKEIVHGIGEGELLHSYIGPNAKSIASFLHFQMALPYRKIRAIFSELFDLDFDPSSCPGFDGQISRNGLEIYEKLKESLKNQPYLHVDETGWRKDAINYWLWLYANNQIAVYDIEKGRGQSQIESVLGKTFGGVIISDFLGAYNKILSLKQRCLVHLLRLIEKWHLYFYDNAKIKKYLDVLKNLIKKIIKLNARLLKGKMPADFSVQKADLRGMLKNLLNKKLEHPKAEKFRLRIAKISDQLTTCLDYVNVCSHNNFAERLLRNNVIMRKITFGNRGDAGIINHQVLMSLIETAKLHNNNPLSFLYKILTNAKEAQDLIKLPFSTA